MGEIQLFNSRGEIKYYKIMPEGNVVPHRIGGPAVIYTKSKKEQYFVNGIRHREDGPAIVTPTIKSYYIKGVPYNKNVYYNDTEAILNRMDLLEEE